MPQRAVELILARQLASSLTVPVLLIDAMGDLIYFNEPAEAVFGRRFDEIDSLPLAQRAAILAPRDRDGRPRPPEQLPGVRAIRERRPVHGAFWITGLDGRPRATESTAVPLEGMQEAVIGALVFIWLSEFPPATELGSVGAVPLAGRGAAVSSHD